MYKPKFNPGDRVLRVNPGAGSIKKDQMYTVESCTANNIVLVGVNGNYDPTYFKLVESSFTENQQSSPSLPTENVFIQFIN